MSARDVLIEAMAHRQFAFGGTYTRWERVDQDVRDGYLHLAGEALDALLAHPVELLALLAEPKVCETCWGDGDLRRTDGYPPGLDEVGKPCVTCHGTGSVKVDVLDMSAEWDAMRLAAAKAMFAQAWPLEDWDTYEVATQDAEEIRAGWLRAADAALSAALPAPCPTCAGRCGYWRDGCWVTVTCADCEPDL